jgi:ABC-2 type transport system ATP-binding protein
MVIVDQLTKRFGAQTAVDVISFEIPAGQIVGFLGPNGAGKSTTLKMLTGMIEPTSGTARVCGFDLSREPIEAKRRVGFVPESGAVFESLTGLEYLEMIAALYGIPRRAARDRIGQFIAFFDLGFDTLTEKLLGAYSKGMRRKVVITGRPLAQSAGRALRRAAGRAGRQRGGRLQGAHSNIGPRGKDDRL